MRLPARPIDLYYSLTVGLMATIRATRSPRLVHLYSRAAGAAAFHLSARKRSRAAAGLDLAMGRQPAPLMHNLLAQSFVSFWEDLLLPFAFEQPGSDDRFTLDGEVHLANALDRGNGVILWESNSFGRRSVAKQVLASRGYSLVQVHLENHLGGLRNDGLHRSSLRGSVLHPILEAWEKEFVDEIIYLPRDGSLAYARTLRRRLQENRIVCSAADGNWGEKNMPIPFFGGAFAFSTGMVSLSRLTGAPLIPLFCWCEKEDRYRTTLFPPLVHPPRTEREEATRQTLTEFSKIFESCVRRFPTQFHNWQSVRRE